MSERRFYLMELDEDGSMVTDLTLAITESELLRRCKAIRQPEFITEDRVIDIIVNGEGEKGVVLLKNDTDATGQTIGYVNAIHAKPAEESPSQWADRHPHNQQPSPTPTRQEWELWAQNVADVIYFRASAEAIMNLLLSMPGVPKG